MYEEVFLLSVDPHPQGQFRLRHEGKKCEIWDFETEAEAITLRRAIGLIDYYSFCVDGKAKVYFEDGALELVQAHITGLKNELAVFDHFMHKVVFPKGKGAIATANSNRPGAGETSSKKSSKVYHPDK